MQFAYYPSYHFFHMKFRWLSINRQLRKTKPYPYICSLLIILTSLFTVTIGAMTSIHVKIRFDKAIAINGIVKVSFWSDYLLQMKLSGLA